MDTPEIKAPEIKDWHSHIYFDAASRDAAWALRERIEKAFEIQMGRFHEKPVGPHPQFSYQVHFRNDQFAPFMAWLTLNRGDLTVFTHPNTGHDLEDHRDRAIWMGQQVPLVLSIFTDRMKG
jgi:aromatic ring-cleaving dioxygenase